ncbi:Frag1/DRAM/Sfk1 family-domain-containing protein [Aspergillus leporis]|uniref:Frag1/DRAM/Sfk1 family-domain-containing protein n=1 Tax=Aspergillus leporis TaxID=41062 RepID=A0A5N5WR05_9EURO|nr:Frag1/DRAM/Sfk1 family-domain-containing protein [Aspergillus leporis]
MGINPLPRCHDAIWFFLHILILNIPPSRLVLFPPLSGSVWFVTLASLLLTWIARGMPKYPGQSNSHVAFISDIASFELKPLFLVGASITAVGFVTTVAAVHVVRYEPGFVLVKGPGGPLVDDNFDDDSRDESLNANCNDRENPDSHSDDEEDQETTRTLKLISLISIFAAVVAGMALILLAVMDTFRYKVAHHVIGFVSFVYHMGIWQHGCGKRNVRVSVFASLSTALILVEVFLAVAFLSLTILEEYSSYRQAGILEWIIAFLGTVYLWLFCGFLDRVLYNPPERGKDVQSSDTSQLQIPNEDPERTSLIGTPTGGRYT